jgi:hypothetical protein
VRKEWTTKHAFTLASLAYKAVTLRGYLGDYDVIIRRKGVAVQKEDIRVDGSGQSFTISVKDTTGDNLQRQTQRETVLMLLTCRKQKNVILTFECTHTMGSVEMTSRC